MRSAVRVLVIALVAILSATKSYGWGGAGHSTIGYIADQNLTPKARKMCNEYLGHSLAYNASWLDRWRYSMEYRNTARWHAVGIKEGKIVPAHMVGATSEGFVPLTMEEQGVTRLNQILEQMKEYKELSDSTVSVNLKCIIHIVGDLHCPCHTLFENEKQYQMNNGGRTVRFHDFVDSAYEQYNGKMTADEFYRDSNHYTKREVKQMCEANVEEWIWENADRFRECYHLLSPEVDYQDLPEENKQRMKEVTNDLLIVAGYRLANVINEIFK